MFSLQKYIFFFFQTSAFPWNRERKSSRLWRDNVSSHHLPPVSPFLFPSHRRPLSVVELNEHEPRFPPKITTPRPFRLWASPTETFHLAYYPLSSISLFPNKLMGSWNKVIKLWKKKTRYPPTASSHGPRARAGWVTLPIQLVSGFSDSVTLMTVFHFLQPSHWERSGIHEVL